MKRTTKIWLSIVATLTAIALILFVAVMTKYQWDFSKLGTGNYETNAYAINDDFNHIRIDTDTADIRLVPSNDQNCSIVCFEPPNAKHCADVQDGTLVIRVVDTRKWYEYIGFNFNAPKVMVYLPQSKYRTLTIREDTGDIEISKDFEFESSDIALSTGDVAFFATVSNLNKIKTSTGRIYIEATSAGNLDLTASTGSIAVFGVACTGDARMKVSTGKTTLTGLICQNLESTGDTGDISLQAVTVTENLSVKRSTGDVKFECADAAEIFIQTDTGNVTGSLLTEKVFITQTDTGRVNIPKTATGGKCEIHTDTGNIKITLENSQSNSKSAES